VIKFWFKKSATEKMFMSNAIAEKPTAKVQRKNVISQISSLREQMDDLNDYLDLLEARARNKGKRTFTTDEVRKQLGLA
jgi:cell division protein FtsB